MSYQAVLDLRRRWQQKWTPAKRKAKIQSAASRATKLFSTYTFEGCPEPFTGAADMAAEIEQALTDIALKHLEAK